MDISQKFSQVVEFIEKNKIEDAVGLVKIIIE